VLWDLGAATMEAAGRPLKEMYYSTNRHATDFTLQLGKRFCEAFFLNSVWPHLTGKFRGNAPADDPMLNVSRVSDALAAPPQHADQIDAAWAAFVANRVASPDLQGPFDTTFFEDAKISRRTAWRAVCDRDLFGATVWQLYDPDAAGHFQLGRERHESKLVRVETAPLIMPLLLFRRVPTSAAASPLDGARGCYVLAHRYAAAVETDRSSDFKLYKPRVLDTSTYCVVPLSELARPLWPLPYFDEVPPPPDAPVPSAESVKAAANTVLVSTYVDFQG
jgi:hypothetical protein